MSFLTEALRNPSKVPKSIAKRLALSHITSDELAIRLLYWAMMGETLDLTEPRTFNAKLQWLKLYDRNPLYTTLVDKAAVKHWVADRIGSNHVVPTYGTWTSFDEIEFDSLPNRFVLKCTHDSGGLAICKDRETFDFNEARRKLEASLARNYFWSGREWPYKHVQPRIIAEEYLEPNDGGEDLEDYKFFCFSGEAKAMFVATNRFGDGETCFDFFDMEYRHLPFTNGHPNADVTPPKPVAFDEMREMAERLSAGIPQVRVDFYESSKGTYFGEMTFSHWGGFVPFDPPEWDERFGNWIDLPGGGCVLLANRWAIWLHEGESYLDERREDALPQGMIDYKFYCFGGEPRWLYVSKGLEDHATARISFLTLDWEFAPFGRPDYAPFVKLPKRPACFDEMASIAKTLSKSIPFVRVDLYESHGNAIFSEMTFSPCAGFMEFDPPEWDLRLGEMLILPGTNIS